MPTYVLNNDDVIERCIQEIRQSHGKMVRIMEPKRTLAQNDYIHALIALIAPHTGYTPEELKRYLKVKLLGVERTIVDGIELVEPRGTSTLDKKECALFIDELTQLAMNLGVKIPMMGYYGVDE